MAEEKNITEILHHMGELDQPFGAVAPPLFQTSIFRFENFDAMHDAFDDEANHYIYSRGNNPTPSSGARSSESTICRMFDGVAVSNSQPKAMYFLPANAGRKGTTSPIANQQRKLTIFSF